MRKNNQGSLRDWQKDRKNIHEKWSDRKKNNQDSFSDGQKKIRGTIGEKETKISKQFTHIRRKNNNETFSV